MTKVSIVVPTVGRASLHDLLKRLKEQLPRNGNGVEVIVVDDSASRRGPAAARNEGWHKATGEWVVFLDDDVLPGYTWWHYLQEDLDQPPDVAGVQGQIVVPNGHRQTDWSANTQRLSAAAWATADMAYRRSALQAVGGFDERFPRAYREDADLAFRVRRAAGRLVLGRRRTVHPVRQESRWISLKTQRGNADDALLRRLYGPGWQRRLSVPCGRRPVHFLTTAALLTMAVPRWRKPAMLVWAATTAEFASTRKRNAPGEPLPSLIATSVLIPPLAVAYWLRGWWTHRKTPRWR
ncbi:glycosyltransferase family 2 protein [Allorhizocola rhizosphaerae]|uniref:glycosyltransferase family 2 protein n=1 Tax=Allorhizocola rhizosphaerae TaxID=1872709 RepID=UPI000E3E4D68|nr:glycosyltransferase [Allorhizocola rhizosphaerae]